MRLASLGTWRPSWPLLLGLGALVRVLAQPRAVLTDPDTYLHIAAGRWMLEHHRLPTHDPFSYTLAGAHWIPHEWLAELVLALTYAGLGWSGLVLVTAACYAVALAVLLRRLLVHFEPISALLVAISAAAILQPHLVVRPHVLALPLMVVWSAELFAARDAGRAPPWWLVAVLLLWANLHGSFMAGLGLCAFLTVDAGLTAPAGTRRAAIRGWAMFLLASTAAGLATPNGLEGFLLPFRMGGMAVLQSAFIEWQPLDLAHFQPLELWLGAAVLGLALGLRLSPLRLVLTAILFHLALVHQRHADLVAVMVPLALGPTLGPELASRIRTNANSPVARGVAALAPAASWRAIGAVILLGGLAGLLSLLNPLTRGDDEETPATALAAAQAARLDGPVFNQEPFGGYLVFEGVPSFIDGRIELFGDRFLARYLQAEAGRPDVLGPLLDRYGVTWTLLSPGTAAVTALDRMPGWHRIHADAVAVVHARAAPAD